MLYLLRVISKSLVMNVSELKDTLVVKNKSDNLVLRTSVKNVNEWKDWFERYCEITKTNWLVAKTYPNPVRIRLGILINAIGTSHAVKQLQTKIKAVQLGWMSPSS